MAASLVRPSVALLPAPSAGLIRELRRFRAKADVVRIPSCALHTVVATEDPSSERYQHVITSGQHTFRGDLSEEWGLAAQLLSLAMCSSMTIRLFADRMRWPLRRVTVTVKEIGKDLRGTLPDALQMTVSLDGDLSDSQKSRLIEISGKCPVKQMMLGKMRNGISVHLSP